MAQPDLLLPLSQPLDLATLAAMVKAPYAQHDWLLERNTPTMDVLILFAQYGLPLETLLLWTTDELFERVRQAANFDAVNHLANELHSRRFILAAFPVPEFIWCRQRQAIIGGLEMHDTAQLLAEYKRQELLAWAKSSPGNLLGQWDVTWRYLDDLDEHVLEIQQTIYPEELVLPGPGHLPYRSRRRPKPSGASASFSLARPLAASSVDSL